MVALLPRGELQVGCGAQSVRASTRRNPTSNWMVEIAAQPRELGLSWTSGPSALRRPELFEPNKRGQYYCLNRNYDIKQGRWISPDQASSPWWDLFDYVRQRSITATDPTGLCVKLDVALLPGKAEKDDWVDSEAETYADDAVRSAQQFWALAKRKVQECKDSGETDCCICKITLYGHCGNGLGGGDVEWAQWQLEELQEMMCEDAYIENWQCWGGVVKWAERDFRTNWTKLLWKKGGIYAGFTGTVQWLLGAWWWGPRTWTMEGKWVYLGFKKGDDMEKAKARHGTADAAGEGQKVGR